MFVYKKIIFVIEVNIVENSNLKSQCEDLKSGEKQGWPSQQKAHLHNNQDTSDRHLDKIRNFHKTSSFSKLHRAP